MGLKLSERKFKSLFYSLDLCKKLYSNQIKYVCYSLFYEVLFIFEGLYLLGNFIASFPPEQNFLTSQAL
jgi:hypothetical protein